MKEDLSDSGIEWVGVKPRSWPVIKLKNFAQIFSSNVDKKVADDEEEVSLCNYVDVYYNDKITLDIPFMTVTATKQEIRKFRLRDDDVLVTKDSEDPNDIAVPAVVSESDEKLVCGYHLSIIRTISTKLNGQFLFWALKDSSIASQLHRQAAGITRWAISRKHLKNVSIPQPGVEEQTRIAQYLDQTCAAIDRAIAVKQQQLEKLGQLGNSIISRVVLEGLESNTDKQPVDSPWLEQIPAGWSLRRLKDAVSIQTGITLGKDYDGELVERPYLRVANVQDGYLDFEEVKTISLPERDVSRYLLQSNDVLMTEGGDLDKLGRGQVWRGEIAGCLHQNHVFAIRCEESMLLPQYLAYLTSSKHGRNYFEVTGKRTTNLASTNSTKVGQFPVPLPPMDEQREIIEYLSSELGKIEKVTTGVRRQVDVLTDYKKSLIHECVTGKRRITEADLRRVA